MKKYLNRIYTILLIILCVVLCVLQIQAGTLLSTGTIIRFVIIFIAYGKTDELPKINGVHPHQIFLKINSEFA